MLRTARPDSRAWSTATHLRFALTLALILGIPARDSASAAETVSAVYVGEADSVDTSSRVATMLSMLSPPVYLDSPPVHLGQLVDLDGITVLGAEMLRTCRGEPIPAETYRERLEALFLSTVTMEDSTLLFEQLEEAQSCLTEPVEPHELARGSFLRGVTVYADDEAAALAAFEAVFVIDPDHPWETDYPPAVQHAYIDAAAAVSRSPRGTVRVAAPALAGIWLDGRPLDPRAGEVSVAAGRHLVQIQAAGEALARSIPLQVAGGARAVVVHPAALEAPSADAGTFVGGMALVLGALHDADPSSPPGYVIALSPEVVAWRWDGASRGLLPVRIPDDATAVVEGVEVVEDEDRQVHPAVPVLLAAGAGLAVAGAVVTAVSASDLREFDAGVRSGELGPFPRAGATEPEVYDLYREWEHKTERVSAGIALLAAGGATLVIAIPVGALAGKSSRQVALAATFLAPDTGAVTRPGAPGGVRFGVVIR